MNGKNEQAFFQKRQINGQHVHEKMFNIMGHQGNANHNHSEIEPHTCQNGHYQKTEIVSVSEDVEKRELMCIVGGNVNLNQPLWKGVWKFLED